MAKWRGVSIRANIKIRKHAWRKRSDIGGETVVNIRIIRIAEQQLK